jgi:Protein kinase domain
MAEHETKVKKTVDAISRYDENILVGKGKPLHFPIPPVQDVAVVHAILAALLRLMATAVEESRTGEKTSSPAKGVQEEQHNEPEKSSLKGRNEADAVLSKGRKSLPFQLRSLLLLSAEIKPLGRETMPLVNIMGQGMDQLLRHQAKQLLYAFGFGGTGVDSHCTGIVMTLVHIEVIQLRFTLESFEFDLLSTGKLPLFPKDCIEEKLVNWKCSNSKDKQEEIKKFLVELFPESADGNASGNSSGIPKGLVMLWKLLNTSSADLFKDYCDGGHYVAEGGGEQYALGVCLGSGAFGDVYSVVDSQEHVIKVAKSGYIPEILDEIETLRSLESENPHIPKLVNHGNLRVLIRSRAVVLPAMMTCPRGESNAHQVFLTIGDDEDELCAVATQMLSALKHAHAKQLCHLDVKPSNIVLVSREPPRYLLVDWGCSRKMCDEVNGFIGSDNYAHDYVHMMDREQKDWKPVEQLDKASLLYTLVVLSRKKEVERIAADWKLTNLQEIKDAADWKKS